MKDMVPLALILTLLAVAIPEVPYALPWDDTGILALEICDCLLAPSWLVAQVDADLVAIRAYEPFLENVHVLPDWVPGELIVKLTVEASEQFHAGEYHGLDALNEQYGPVEMSILVEWYGSIWLLLSFSQMYHPELLADIYGVAEGVIWASPNDITGAGSDIFSEFLGTYTFKYGWDCDLMHCLRYHFWVFVVEDGVVELIDEYVSVEKTTWGSIKAMYR